MYRKVRLFTVVRKVVDCGLDYSQSCYAETKFIFVIQAWKNTFQFVFVNANLIT